MTVEGCDNFSEIMMIIADFKAENPESDFEFEDSQNLCSNGMSVEIKVLD